MEENVIEVVSGVVVRNKRLLLTQRRADKEFPMLWETPGGKVETGESHRDALVRELKEEVGVDVVAVAESSMFSSVVDRGEGGSVRVSLFVVEIAKDAVPSPMEGQGIGWFTAEEVGVLELVPGSAAAVRSLTWYTNAAEGIRSNEEDKARRARSE